MILIAYSNMSIFIVFKLQFYITLHYNHVQMTRNHMALSIDDNDDLKENQELQLQSQSH